MPKWSEVQHEDIEDIQKLKINISFHFNMYTMETYRICLTGTGRYMQKHIEIFVFFHLHNM